MEKKDMWVVCLLSPSEPLEGTWRLSFLREQHPGPRQLPPTAPLCTAQARLGSSCLKLWHKTPVLGLL